MPYDCEAFKKVLEETPFDHEWDEKMPTQKGYKAAGLKRYKLDHGDAWEKTLFSEKKEETFSSNQNMQTGVSVHSRFQVALRSRSRSRSGPCCWWRSG